MYNKLYVDAWKMIKLKKYYLAKTIFNKLLSLKHCKTYSDIGGFYYYGLYGYEKNLKKSIFFYEKAFLCQENKETFNDFVTAKVECSGKIKTILYIVTNKKLLQKIIKSGIK